MEDFLFRGSLRELDPDVFELAQLEAERQARKLILIASESQAPLAVREALSSAFQNIYAEGYPDEETRRMSQAEILLCGWKMAMVPQKESFLQFQNHYHQDWKCFGSRK